MLDATKHFYAIPLINIGLVREKSLEWTHNMKKDPTAGLLPSLAHQLLMIWCPVERQQKTNFSIRKILLRFRVKNETASRELEETFWHSMRVCAGVSLEFCQMKRFFKIKISTYNTIGHKFINLKVDFRPGVFHLGFERVSTDSRFHAMFLWKCITYLRINLKSKLFGKQLCR